MCLSINASITWAPDKGPVFSGAVIPLGHTEENLLKGHLLFQFVLVMCFCTANTPQTLEAKAEINAVYSFLYSNSSGAGEPLPWLQASCCEPGCLIWRFEWGQKTLSRWFTGTSAGRRLSPRTQGALWRSCPHSVAAEWGGSHSVLDGLDSKSHSTIPYWLTGQVYSIQEETTPGFGKQECTEVTMGI